LGLYQSIVGHLTFGLRSCDALDVKSERDHIFKKIDGTIKKLSLINCNPVTY